MANLKFTIQRENQPDQDVTIRPRTSDDHSAITALYGNIPVEETEYFVVDVQNSTVISQWFEPNDFVETVALVAETSEAIVGEAVLVRQKNPRLSHVGNIRFYIHPDWRKAGLGATLVSSLFTSAMNMGIEKICIYLPEPGAQRFDAMLSRNGFSKEAILRNHYRSRNGTKRDIIVYGRDLEELWHRISDWVSNYGRAMEY
ncbi:MAG TPA: GNAT family N-acetyltransferase [bacterium]|nr:GNAT family N-acetyltransferase [bacterium]